VLLPPARSDLLVGVLGALGGSFAACADKENKVIFTGSKSGSFASVDARNLVKERRYTISWHGMVWFHPNVPKFPHITLLAAHE